jgi:hypothetical protein
MTLLIDAFDSGRSGMLWPSRSMTPASSTRTRGTLDRRGRQRGHPAASNVRRGSRQAAPRERPSRARWSSPGDPFPAARAGGAPRRSSADRTFAGRPYGCERQSCRWSGGASDAPCRPFRRRHGRSASASLAGGYANRREPVWSNARDHTWMSCALPFGPPARGKHPGGSMRQPTAEPASRDGAGLAATGWDNVVPNSRQNPADTGCFPGRIPRAAPRFLPANPLDQWRAVRASHARGRRFEPAAPILRNPCICRTPARGTRITSFGGLHDVVVLVDGPNGSTHPVNGGRAMSTPAGSSWGPTGATGPACATDDAGEGVR